MATIINAGTATGGAAITADTTGILALQSGSTPTTAVTIDASQNVGIGTSSPSAKLSVLGTGYYQKTGGSGVYGTNLTYYSGGGDIAMNIGTDVSGFVYQSVITNHAMVFGTNNVERMRIDSSGNVGMGTSSPVGRLDVTGVAGTNADARAVIYATDTTAFAAGVGGGITFRAKYNTAGSYVDAGNIKGIKENATDGNFATALVFTNSSNGASPSEKMRIDSSGNVGIGYNNPLTKLYVLDTAKTSTSPFANLIGTFRSNATNADCSIQFSDNTTYSSVIGQIGGSSGAFGFNVGGAERMRIDSSGNLLVGTTNTNPVSSRVNGTALSLPSTGLNFIARSSSGQMALQYAGNAGTHISFYTDNGSASIGAGAISSSGTTTTYGTGSDYRMKENIQPMINALDKVQKLKPVIYTWKSEFAGDNPNGQGFIAHELQAVVPDCVTGEKDAVDAEGNPQYQGIDTSFLVATLTAAIQELNAKVDAQAAEIKALKGVA